jgi:5'-nucleotidase
MAKKTVLIDIDDTIGDWNEMFHDNVKLLFPDVVIPSVDKRNSFFLLETNTGLTEEMMQHIFHIEGSYRNLTPIDGAIAALKQMEEQGIQAYLCTSPIYTNESCASDKISWVREHFGDWWGDRTIITKDKTLIRGDYLIDDKQVIEGVMTPEWERIVFDRVYNREVDGRRLNSWDNWTTVLADCL